MKEKWSPTFRYWVLTALSLLSLYLVWYARELIGPLVIGALLAYVLNPMVRFLSERTHLSRSLIITIVFLLVLGLLVGLSTWLIPVLLAELQTLTADLDASITWLQTFLQEPVVFMQWTFHLENLIPDPGGLLSEQLFTLPENVFHIIEATTVNLIWLLVILATTYYLLRDWERLRDWLLGLAPDKFQPTAQHLYHEIKDVWSGYLRGNLVLMAIVGVVFSLAWLAMGLPGALILGIIAGLLTIIPDLGPAIAAILAIVVALIEGSNTLPISNFWFALLVLGVYLLLVNIKTIWIRPRIFAHSVHMHDGLVFIAIMAAVVLNGILGALVVVPVMASVAIVGRYLFCRLLGIPAWPEEIEERTPSEPIELIE